MMPRAVPRPAAGFAFVLLALLAGLIPAASEGPAAGPHPLVVIATSSNRGEVDPCG